MKERRIKQYRDALNSVVNKFENTNREMQRLANNFLKAYSRSTERITTMLRNVDTQMALLLVKTNEKIDEINRINSNRYKKKETDSDE